MAYSLLELNTHLRQIVALNLPDAIWIRCELAQVNEARGHYYLQLVQPDETHSDQIVARASAIIWQRRYRQLQRKIGRTLDVILSEGTAVLLQVQVEFNEKYGLSLLVEDLDPNYTLGKLEEHRRAILKDLEKRQLLRQQAELQLPVVLQNIAIISSATAAGYQDYLHHLRDNPAGYQFRQQLFQSAMQGTSVEAEFLKALRQIRRKRKTFDAVVVLRGGGARLDLSAFDNAKIAEEVANFPLPIITGIGHDVDDTVLDHVAHRSLKTPTAVADFLWQHNTAFEHDLTITVRSIFEQAEQHTRRATEQLDHLQIRLGENARSLIREHQLRWTVLQEALRTVPIQRLRTANQALNFMTETIELLSPEAALRRGFVIVERAGQTVRASSELAADELITLRFHDGKIAASVTGTDPSDT